MSIYLEEFYEHIDNIEVSQNSTNHILKLHYVYIITCMETYLYRAFWGLLDENPSKYQELAKGIDQSVKLKTIYTQGLNKYIKNVLFKDIQFHNIFQVKIHYKHAFDIDFPRDLKNIGKAIGYRHDIVHRCGYSKSGNKVEIDYEIFQKLNIDILEFINFLDIQIEK